MPEYKPSQPPDAEEWLEMDEAERIRLVSEFHDEEGDDLLDGARELHSSFHVIVENQIAMKESLVSETIDKLTRQGLDRHEAIHAVAALLSEDIFDLYKGNIEKFDQKKYRRKLEKLTAKRWRKGQY
ncbi:MAG: DUF1841 family protein [Candidatus Thiodiazotropha sp.]